MCFHVGEGLVPSRAGGTGHRDNAKLIADEHNNRIWLYGGSKFDGWRLTIPLAGEN